MFKVTILIITFIQFTHLTLFCQENDSIIFSNKFITIRIIERLSLKLDRDCDLSVTSKFTVPEKAGLEYCVNSLNSDKKISLYIKGKNNLNLYDNFGKFEAKAGIPIYTEYLRANAINNLIFYSFKPNVLALNMSTKKQNKILSIMDFIKTFDFDIYEFMQNCDFEIPENTYDFKTNVPKYFCNKEDSTLFIFSNNYLYKYNLNKSKKNNRFYFSPFFENFRINPLYFNSKFGVYYDMYKGLIYLNLETEESSEIFKEVPSNISIGFLNLDKKQFFLPYKKDNCTIYLYKCLIYLVK